jgi:hypothetical protein
MTNLKRLADLVRGCDMLDADRDYLATLLRSAAGETVGTEWDHADTMSAPYPQRACVRHNADLSACRLALAAAHKERDEAVADRAEFMRAADRLYHAASEQQHTLGSKGWHRTDAIRWSAAGARWEQYQNLAASLLDMADVMQAMNPSKLEARGPYAEVVEKNAALQRAIDEAIIFVEGHLTDENRRKLLAATLRPHATPSQPERAKEPKVDHLKPLIERHEATLASLREISEGVKRMIDTPPLPTEPQPAPRPCDCRELVARLTECVEALASRRVFPHFLRDIIRDARGGGA